MLKVEITSDQIPLLMVQLPLAASQNAGFVFDGTNLEVPDAYASQVQAVMAATNWQANGSTVKLLSYAAQARFLKEVGGTTVNGVTYATDRDTQAAINGAYNLSVVNPSLTVDWKLPNGTFTTLNAAAILAAATAIGNFVQKCFGTEAAVAAAINASPPTITTTAQIDAQFATFS